MKEDLSPQSGILEGRAREAGQDISQALPNSEILSHEKPTTASAAAIVCWRVIHQRTKLVLHSVIKLGGTTV